MDFYKLSEEIALLNSYQNLAQWDYETLMPKGAANWRAQMLGYMAGQIHLKATSEEYLNSAKAALQIEADPINKASIEKTILNIEKFKKIPQKLIEEINQATTLSHAAWDEAKNTNDFSKFAQHLEKMIQLIKTQTEYLAKGRFDNLYDTLLEEYSPGMNTRFIDELFAKLRPELIQLLQHKKPKLNKTWSVPVDVQQKICADVIKWFKFKTENLTMATSSHPFCLTVFPEDVRITTRYNESNPIDSLFSVVHELGHGLYENQLSTAHPGTARMEANGMDLHESQSRFWEVCVGSTQEFYSWIWSWFEQNAPQYIAGWNMDELYLLGTQVETSLIRTEADPVTYGLHVMVRYEIEKLIFAGKIQVSELPKKWNSLYQEYLGITPSTDSQGVLQDVHWSGGGFGYFPSYLLGTMIACQLFEAYLKVNPNFMNQIKTGDVYEVHSWLKENVHQFGKGKSTRQILIDVTGSDLTVEPFLNLLKSRYCQ